MQIKDVLQEVETFAPLVYQEDYDNSGLLCGDKEEHVTAVLLSLDCTEEVVDEAIAKNCNLIIAHHPLIFSGIKKLVGSSYVERTLIKAIKHNIAIYACHTNLDNVKAGVNFKIAQKLGLSHLHILAPKPGQYQKLITYVPPTHHEAVLAALFGSGAGQIGNYGECSFNSEGTGTFKGNDLSKPFLGKANELSQEKEIRIETIFEKSRQKELINSLLSAHPYEEVAYDIYDLDKQHPGIGSGMWGEFEQAMPEIDFLNHVKISFGLKVLKHTRFTGKMIKKVAFCGGSGRFLLKNAISSGSEAYITSDFKYHEYFEAENKLLLVDIGHFESEQFTPEIFYEIIQKKFTTFAIHLSKMNTNPINYF